MESISSLLLTFLLNACWQIVLLTTIAAVCDWLLRATPARYRHLLWATVLILSLGLPGLTCFSFTSNSIFKATPSLMTEATAISPVIIAKETSAGQLSSNVAVTINKNFAAVLFALFFALICYRSIKLCKAWRQTRAIVRSASPIELTGQIQTIIAKCQTTIGVIKVQLLSSTVVSVPITMGVRNPLIILPAQLLQEANANVLTSAIGHELVHVKRRDFALNLIYEFIYLLLSFHPVAALVRRRIKETREIICDEMVASSLLEPKVYARSLVHLAGSAMNFSRNLTITIGIGDADILEERVMTILKKSNLSPRRKNLLLLAAACLLVVPCIAAAKFSLHPNLAFEAVTQQTENQVVKQKAELKAKQKSEQDAQQRGEKKDMLLAKQELESEQKVLAKHRAEEDMLAKHRAEEELLVKGGLASQAKVGMQQAIQTALNLHPGTVVESQLVSKLIGDKGEVCYAIQIYSEEEKARVTHLVLISAIDGRIITQ